MKCERIEFLEKCVEKAIDHAEKCELFYMLLEKAITEKNERLYVENSALKREIAKLKTTRDPEWRQTADAPIPESVPVLAFNAAFGFSVVRREGDIMYGMNPKTGLMFEDTSGIDWEWWRILREPQRTGATVCRVCGGTRFLCGCA